MKKKILFTIMVLAFTVFTGALLPGEAVFANGEGSAFIGTNPTGGSCGRVGITWDTCFGYSWQVYKVTTDLPVSGTGATFFSTKNTGGPVEIYGCKAGQEIYNYGFEVYKGNADGSKRAIRIRNGVEFAIGYDEDGRQVSTQVNKNGTQAPHSAAAKGVYIGSNGWEEDGVQKNFAGNIQNYVDNSSVRYATMDEAEEAFELFLQHIDDPDWSITMDGDVDWDTVGAFCFSEDWITEPSDFYAQSKVEAQKVGGGSSASADTGIVGTSVTADAQNDVMVSEGEQVKITFTHNVYSSKKVTDDKSWSTAKRFSSSNVTISGGSGRTSGVTKFTGQSGSYYKADTRYSGNDLLQNVYTATFSAKGYYDFCESVTIEGVTTTACVSVNVDKPEEDCITRGDCPEEKPCGWELPYSFTSSNANSGTTSVVSKVRNLSLSNWNIYSSFRDEVYAKPGDNVNWCNAYYPGVQRTANSEVTMYNSDPEPFRIANGTTNVLNNKKFLDYSDWTNKFSISSINIRPYYSYGVVSFNAGDSEPKEVSNNDEIDLGQAGQTLSETITTGFPTSASRNNEGRHGWSCNPYPSTCGANPSYPCTRYKTCRHSNNFWWNTRSGTASDTSYVKVPYNFKNTATVNIKEATLVYAAETMTIDYSKVTVNTKQNNVTEGNYATQVDQAQTKLVGYLSSSSTGTEKTDHPNSNICSGLPVKNGSCNELNSYSGKTFNSSAKMEGSTDDLGFANQTYNVYDAKAGDYYCVVVAVYPSTSGDDKNLNASGDNKWYISKPSCRIIAKRPSFQVWGGSIYSARSIKTSNATKNNLLGVYSYTTTSKRDTVIFGSWVEHAVMSNGFVTGLASGAATGEVAAAHRSGSKEGVSPNYCTYRVPLSIANWSTAGFSSICPNVQAVGQAQLPNAAVDRDALMDYWNVSGANYVNKTSINLAVDYMETTTIQGNRVNYTEVPGGLSQVSLTATTIKKGATHVMRTSGDIKIEGNIVYESTTYRSQKEIPKVIIYAGGDITIACNVTRIDAIIIAGGKVETCDTDDDDENAINSAAVSRQLVINGMVMSDSLKLKRTYGAQTGIGSGLPAEIINYDTSAIIWGKGMATTTDSDTLTTVYQHEIAPRY